MKIFSALLARFRRRRSASIPLMITHDMRRGLLELGVLPSEIREMTPQQAWERLNRRDRTTYWAGNFPSTLLPW